MEEATFPQAPTMPALAPGNSKATFPQGVPTACCLGQKEMAAHVCSFLHSLSKHSISAKPMLRACGDQRTHQPVFPTPFLGHCTQQPWTLDRAFWWAEHFFGGTTSYPKWGTTAFLSSSKPFRTSSLARNPVTPK